MVRLPPILLLGLLLAALTGCAREEPVSATLPPIAGTTIRDPQPAPRRPTQTTGIIAERGYERLLLGRRAAVTRVTWSWAEREGQRVIRDQTRVHARTTRMMLDVKDVFETSMDIDLYRTESGELLYQKLVVREGSRVSTEVVTRTASGYDVVASVGSNRDSFHVVTDSPGQTDAETFLLPRILRGEATPGRVFTMRVLSTAQKKMIESTLQVVGQDDEGPGLKVIQTTKGHVTLWWFAPDGVVMRTRAGDSVTRRADNLGLDDLPRTPASYSITLRSNIDLPRAFVSKTMLVDLLVRTDDTVRPPKIPLNPFTEVIEEGPDRVRLLLKAHDDPTANVALSEIDGEEFKEFLKPTPLMEVDDPAIRARARAVVGEAKDARTAAKRIADWVFHFLGKNSPATADPGAKEILRLGQGDCSEHCLLFTTLCRAAGIPARRVSGFVNIGSDWGGHAWSEIWLGKWIGADPTTNEIGTRARYIFCGRQDESEVPLAVIRADRTRILIRQVEYVDGRLTIGNAKPDPVLLSGIVFGKLPAGWTERRDGVNASITTPGFRVDALVVPDQGYRSTSDIKRRYRGGEASRFGGRLAVRQRYGRSTHWIVPLGRQNLEISVRSLQRGAAIPIREIEKAFAPTLQRQE